MEDLVCDDENGDRRGIENRGCCGCSEITYTTLAVAKSMCSLGNFEMKDIMSEQIRFYLLAAQLGHLCHWNESSKAIFQVLSYYNVNPKNTWKTNHADHKLPPSPNIPLPPHPVTYLTSGSSYSMDGTFLPQLLVVGTFYSSQSLLHYSNSRKLWEVERLTRMTHNSSIPVIAAWILVQFVEKILRTEKFLSTVVNRSQRKLIILELLILAMGYENLLNEKSHTLSSAINKWSDAIDFTYDDIDLIHTNISPQKKTLTCVDHLILVFSYFVSFGLDPEFPPESISKTHLPSIRPALSIYAAMVGLIHGPRPHLHPNLSPLLIKKISNYIKKFASLIKYEKQVKPKASDIYPGNTLDLTPSKTERTKSPPLREDTFKRWSQTRNRANYKQVSWMPWRLHVGLWLGDVLSNTISNFLLKHSVQDLLRYTVTTEKGRFGTLTIITMALSVKILLLLSKPPNL